MKPKDIDEKIDELFLQVNGNGKLQKFALFIICCATNSTGYVVYTLGYLELMPEFICNAVGSTVTYTCKED